jgi:hypothetical protein
MSLLENVVEKYYLAVESCGVMTCPKYIEQVFVAALCRVEFYPHHFRMSCIIHRTSKLS